MSTLSRRGFLKRSGKTAALVSVATPLAAVATQEHGEPDGGGDSQTLALEAADQNAMLFDATLCIGCRACEIACNEDNELGRTEDEIFEGRPAEDARALGNDCWTYVTFHQDEADPTTASFGKVQCMHCIEPACASSCPVSALEKTPEGPVMWHDDLCLGCRYCMMACPFLVPRFEWYDLNPRITKCDMCYDRQIEGNAPACVESCPTGSLLWGTRADMLEEAHQRIVDNPRGYVHHIYGENEAGGTNFLHMAAQPFDDLGYRRNLPMRSYRDYTRPAMGPIPFVMTGLAFTLGAVAWVAGGHDEEEGEEHTPAGTSRSDDEGGAS